MVPSLTDAVAIFRKWEEDSAEVLIVSESPFQQSRRGVLEQSIDWTLGSKTRSPRSRSMPICRGRRLLRWRWRQQVAAPTIREFMKEESNEE